MDAILEKFTGKIDAKAVITMVEDIKREYLGDGLQKEDIPPIVGKLVTNTAKFTLLEGPQKKSLLLDSSTTSLKKLIRVTKILYLKLFSKLWCLHLLTDSLPCLKLKKLCLMHSGAVVNQIKDLGH